MQSLLRITLIALLSASTALAQQKPGGDYAGSLGPLHLKLHLKADAAGVLTGTLDSVDQGALGLACADIQIDGENLSFTVPVVNGSWKGTIAKDGNTLTGIWNQGAPTPLVFARELPFIAGKPSPIDGVWLGSIDAGGQTLRIQVTFKSDASGKEICSLDSLDQGAMGLECNHIVYAGANLSFELPVANGSWSGKLSPDANTLSGNWKQGDTIPFSMTRQAKAETAKAVAPPAFDPALPKVKVEDLQSVLSADLAEQLQPGGAFTPGSGVGVSIALVQHGVHRAFTYGEARTDSIFEIGSLTKSFTALILAQMVAQNQVKLDQPVRELLPANSVPKPQGEEITLLDLATQHSGLPRLPGNLKPADESNPYASYRAADLYAFLAGQGLAKPKDAGFLYSNLGFGLLGQALANKAASAWPELLREQVTGPLGLKDTLVELSTEQQARFLPAHDGQLHPAHPWDFLALAGAGAIRSTAPEMLSYLEANLRPEKLHPDPAFTGSASLRQALEDQHKLRASAGPRMSIALAWLYDVAEGVYWHNGETGGYSAYAFFSPLDDTAGVVLVNAAIPLTDKIGQHIRARLSGDRAISLGK